MNRRELIQKTALAGLATGVGSISGLKKAFANSSRIAAPSPLHVTAGGNMPVAIVLGKGAVLLDFTGPLEVFTGAVTMDGKELFAPYMVATKKEPVIVGGGMKIIPDYDFTSAPQPKVIVIPAMNFSEKDTEMFDWIRAASKAADVTMSVCNGAFILAKTGLLDGKSATCHHGAFFEFAATYPNIRLKRGARFVENGNIASSGGVSCGIDLALRVVERYGGHHLAAEVVDGMEYQGRGWLDPNSNDVYAKMPEQTDARPYCVVCLMEDSNRSISTNYKSKTFYFCSEEHKTIFEKYTDVYERFLAEDAKA